MALYMKQEFSPPVLSRKWIVMKFRPNMLIKSRTHIISILESGLLFREDCTEVEQEAPSPEDVWTACGGRWGGWLTWGEGLVALAGVVASAYMFPPRSLNRTCLINVAVYTSIPILVRAFHRGRALSPLPRLISSMQEYLWLARCAAACLKEYRALHNDMESVRAAVEATHTTLCRQQSELSVSLARCSSALLGNLPWLQQDISWEAIERDNSDNLMKIHHAFMVIQSTFLKHLAMAHFIPPYNVRMKYKNHNERIYWIHNTLIKDLNDQFKENLEILHRMYRMLKASSFKDIEVKKSNMPLNKAWTFSEVHTDIARTALELKLALDRSTKLDVFLDACAINNQNLEIDVLDKDIDSIIDIVTKTLKTVQNAQIRLRKMKPKVTADDTLIKDETTSTDLIESAPMSLVESFTEPKDEVFYFVKTDDDSSYTDLAVDFNTAPGKKETETTKIVLNELKRKLGNREDIMRERERQALMKTMPEFKDKTPEFPRQIKFDDFLDRKGYIHKIKKEKPQKNKLFKNYKINKRNNDKMPKYKIKVKKYEYEFDIKGYIYEANALLNVKSKLLTIASQNNELIIVKWRKVNSAKDLDVSDYSISDLGSYPTNKPKNLELKSHHLSKPDNLSYKCSKRDLELTESSDSDFENFNDQRQLLHDERRNRVARKKIPPSQYLKATIDNVDESMKPIEYSLGTGLAMASVLQVNNAKHLNMAPEEVFIGDGEASNDSGNDEDA